MSRYTAITADEVRQVLKSEKGWVETQPHGEYVYRYAMKKIPGVEVLVYSSVRRDTDRGRSKGEDAIRVCAVKGDKGYIRSARVYRTHGWQTRLKLRCLGVIRMAESRYLKEVSRAVALNPLHPMNNWHQNSKGFSADISEVAGDGETHVSLPPNGYRVAINRFTPHRDADNDVTHWTYATEDGNVYTIFND